MNAGGEGDLSSIQFSIQHSLKDIPSKEIRQIKPFDPDERHNPGHFAAPHRAKGIVGEPARMGRYIGYG
jgi:hypothetical protein